MNWMAWVGSAVGILAGAWVFCRYLLFARIRLDAKTFKAIYEIGKHEKFQFILEEDFVNSSRYPVEFMALCWFSHAPLFLINHFERLLTTGWISKDQVTYATCFRWNKRKFKRYLTHKVEELQLKMGVPVDVITPAYTDTIGLIKSVAAKPIAPENQWADLEQEAQKVFSGELPKSGAILHGKPGNGKTHFIRYLASKYGIPIKIIILSPDFTNHDIMSMFGQIPKRCIVLLEDFDNYFHGRKCVMGDQNHNVKFTFDVVLNCLDGVFNTYENVFFIMTVNDLTKVDTAISRRPSRFKFVREFVGLDEATKMNILQNEQWVRACERLNLDQIMRMVEFKNQGLTIEDAKKNLGLKTEQEIQNKAHEIYINRIKSGEKGDHFSDWMGAIQTC